MTGSIVITNVKLAKGLNYVKIEEMRNGTNYFAQ
jgi:hypothetical protein